MGESIFLNINQFIKDGHWSFPAASTNEVAEVFLLIRAGDSPCVKHEDEVIWSGSFSSDFSIASSLSDQHSTPAVAWSDFLWFKGSINKHSICA